MPLHHRIIKRSFDLVVSALGLLVLWPVIIACVIAAQRDTGLPGLFSQPRVGRHGKIIRIRKIRTMRVMDGVDTNITVADDARITMLGHKLRRLKLDELPQLWNVLMGDMSLVGPRPDVPGYADCLQGADRRMLMLRPGITGPATIKYSDEEALLNRVPDARIYNDTVLYPDKVRLNLQYLDNWSLIGDIRYILITLHLLSKPAELQSCYEIEGGKA